MVWPKANLYVANFQPWTKTDQSKQHFLHPIQQWYNNDNEKVKRGEEKKERKRKEEEEGE